MTSGEKCGIVDRHSRKRVRAYGPQLAPCKLNNESITVVEETAEVSTFEGSGGKRKRKPGLKESPTETAESVVGTRL